MFYLGPEMICIYSKETQMLAGDLTSFPATGNLY